MKALSKSMDQFNGATIRTLRLKPVTTVSSESHCAEAIEIMRDKGFDQLPVRAPQGKKLVGLVTLGNILSWMSSGRANNQTPISRVMFNFAKINEVITDPRDIGDLAPHGDRSQASLTNGKTGLNNTTQNRKFVEITLDTPLQALMKFFEWNSAAVVTDRDEQKNMRPVAVVTKVDLLTWLVKQGNGTARAQDC